MPLHFLCRRKGLTGSASRQSRQDTDLLSPDQFRWFWITWSDDVISCGKGHHVGRDVIIRYHDSSAPTVNFMSVGSAESYSAYWLIPSLYYDIGRL